MNEFVTLNNGVKMPLLGFGVFQSSTEDTAEAVATAIRVGYRLIDTAAVYRNERQTGEGIRRSELSRDELFVTTKVWMSDYGYDATLRAFDKSMAKLGLEVLDLYLIHWPAPSEFDATLASYNALEQLVADGRVRAIGVSNFGPKDLRILSEHSELVPAVNQVELHPYFAQPALRALHQEKGILTQAWSPIGGINRYGGASVPDPLQDPSLVAIAAEHGKTVAQIVLRWHLQHGISAIPKSVRASRIAENFAIFDFALSPEQMAAIDALDRNQRGGSNPELVHSKSFTISVDD
ncbi:MAG: aldo/keto reductase [Myxococcota bacterium]|nr:aldo/keto reductase [Myxococcota bacterium]